MGLMAHELIIFMNYICITRCIKVQAIETQSVLKPEHELETILLGVGVPMRPVPVAGIVRLILYFARRYAESDGLVRLGSDLSRYEWMALLKGAE